MEDRPDLRRLEPLRGEVAGSRVTVRVDRLRYGTDPLHEAVAAGRRLLQSATPGVDAAVDLTIKEVRLERRAASTAVTSPSPAGN